MILRRRGLVAAIGAGLVAAPSLLREGIAMPVRVWTPPPPPRPVLRARFLNARGEVVAESRTPCPDMPDLRLSLYGADGPAVTVLCGDTDPVPAPQDSWIVRAEVTVEGAPGFPPVPLFIGMWDAPQFVAAGDPCRVHDLRFSLRN